MTWVPAVGECIVVPSGPKPHLFVVVFGPQVLTGYGTNPQVLMANVTSCVPNTQHDASCILNTGDHSFVTHASYIAYNFMRVEAEATIMKMVNSKVWMPDATCPGQTLQRIFAGICASKRTVKEYKRIFGCP